MCQHTLCRMAALPAARAHQATSLCQPHRATAAAEFGPGAVPGIAPQVLGFWCAVPGWAEVRAVQCLLCRARGLPGSQPPLGPGLLLLQQGMLEAQQSDILLSLAHRFYWCDLAFWLIGELTRNKTIFSLFLLLSCGFDLFFICVV